MESKLREVEYPDTKKNETHKATVFTLVKRDNGSSVALESIHLSVAVSRTAWWKMRIIVSVVRRLSRKWTRVRDERAVTGVEIELPRSGPVSLAMLKVTGEPGNNWV